MKDGEYKRVVFYLSLLLCATFFILFLSLGYNYYSNEDEKLEKAMEDSKVQSQNYAMEIGSTFVEVVTITESIKGLLYFWQLEDDQVVLRLKGIMEEYPDFYGVIVAYKPYAYDSESRLYAPYYVRKHDELQLLHIEDTYDYTLPDYEDGSGPRTMWYHRPLEEGGCWTEPYFGLASGTFVTGYGIPFYNKSNQVAGVVATVYSLDGVRELVASLDLSENGYGFIVTEKGNIVSHPISEYLGKNIRYLEKDDETLCAINQALEIDQKGIINGVQIHDDFTGKTYWIFCEQIPSTNWTLVTVFVQEEILRDIKTIQRKLLIKISIYFIVFLSFLFILLTGAYKGSYRSLWATAIFISILFIIDTSFIYYLSIQDSPSEENVELIVLDHAGLDASLKNYFAIDIQPPSNREYDLNKKPSPLVPTGIFIKSLKFLGSNEVAVAGYIWQKFEEEINNGATPGFVLPQAQELEIEEFYRDENVIGWNFKATLRQPFDYSKYPFDRQVIWIRIQHNKFYDNMILIPDFESYNAINPIVKPGLEPEIVLEGWQILESYFGYMKCSYNTNLGIESYMNTGNPELCFNVEVKRFFMNFLVSDMIPIIVVSLLLFAVLRISTKKKEMIELYGFSASTVLEYCAALFFVLIISHISLRQQFATEGVVYLEFIYFIIYFAILAVSINAIILSSNNIVACYRDNLIVKLLYWPVITGLILITTVLFFY